MGTPMLTGPWMACLADDAGFCTDDIEEMFSEWGTISVVRASALPNGRDGGLRLPGSHLVSDVLYEKSIDDFEDSDELREAWSLAQQVAALLNDVAVVHARTVGGDS